MQFVRYLAVHFREPGNGTVPAGKRLLSTSEGLSELTRLSRSKRRKTASGRCEWMHQGKYRGTWSSGSRGKNGCARHVEWGLHALCCCVSPAVSLYSNNSSCFRAVCDAQLHQTTCISTSSAASLGATGAGNPLSPTFFYCSVSVSYTHLTLPTIYSV